MSSCTSGIWRRRCSTGSTGTPSPSPATGGSADHRSVALRHGQITLVLTQATSDHHPASAYVAEHGDGVADIALRTADVGAAFAAAVANGARGHRGPTRHADGGAGTAGVPGPAP